MADGNACPPGVSDLELDTHTVSAGPATHRPLSFSQVSTHAHGPVNIYREKLSSASKVQLLTLVHSALERAPLPLGVERPLKRLHAARQLVEARVVDDQDAVEVVELVLEGLGLGLGLGLLG